MSPFFSKADHSLLVTLIEKLSVTEFKKGDTILEQDEEDNVQLIVLEGAISKRKGDRIISHFDRHSAIGDDVLR